MRNLVTMAERFFMVNSVLGFLEEVPVVQVDGKDGEPPREGAIVVFECVRCTTTVGKLSWTAVASFEVRARADVLLSGIGDIKIAAEEAAHDFVHEARMEMDIRIVHFCATNGGSDRYVGCDAKVLLIYITSEHI